MVAAGLWRNLMTGGRRLAGGSSWWRGGRERYMARAARRHAGHLDTARAESELWGEPSRPPGLGPVVPVDTSGPVDTGRLAAALAQVLAASWARDRWS